MAANTKNDTGEEKPGAFVYLPLSQSGTPTINWMTPAAITYGTALSGTQLDATATNNGASVAGAFVYLPPTATVLAAGAQTLWVTFTPNNTADYTSAGASVTVQVNQGQVVNVSNFGAVGDGSTDNTTAFATAFGAACASPTTARFTSRPGSSSSTQLGHVHLDSAAGN